MGCCAPHHANFLGQSAQNVHWPKGVSGGRRGICGRGAVLERLGLDVSEAAALGLGDFQTVSVVYGRRPSDVSAAMRNAAARNARLSLGMTAFFLNLWIFAVSLSFSSAILT